MDYEKRESALLTKVEAMDDAGWRRRRLLSYGLMTWGVLGLAMFHDPFDKEFAWNFWLSIYFLVWGLHSRVVGRRDRLLAKVIKHLGDEGHSWRGVDEHP